MKTKRLELRLTEIQKNKISDLAKKKGFIKKNGEANYSDYLLSMALSGEDNGYVELIKLKTEGIHNIRNILNMANPLGSNINQISKKLNSMNPEYLKKIEKDILFFSLKELNKYVNDLKLEVYKVI